MKLQKIKSIGIVLFIVTILSSGCEKYLGVDPDMRTEIQNLDKLSQLLVSGYPDRHYFTFAEVASDNAEDKGAQYAGSNNEPYIGLYHWNEVLERGNGTPAEYWFACYRAVATANQALESIANNDFSGQKTLQGSNVNQFKGEALIARAYSIFMLSIFFSEPYEIGGANSGLGIPYPLIPETTVNPSYERGTLADTYAQIEKDLTEGLALLQGINHEVPKFHFTEQAAHAFAARFYLFKGEWDKVIEHATAMYPTSTFRSNVRQYVQKLSPLSYDEYRAAYTSSQNTWNVLLASTYSFEQRYDYNGGARYSFGETVKNIYTGTTSFGAPFLQKFGSWTAPNYTTNKFNETFFYTNIQAGIGVAYIMSPILTADEALLNRAEAYIQNEDFANAIKDLNDFASTRISGYSPSTHGMTAAKAKTYFNVTDDKEALLMVVLEAKRKEFMQEGIRWMDILRHKLTVKHNHIASDGTETFQELPAGDKRRVFQIPQDAINNGIIRNPR
ncbi:RagB/SusD family nutrient uptake outer membrane protein [Sphingobacterium faecale]|uniref:RagB/SusD family nutrient uptake outer membrane protein n=1 Tax=Sphingobacterium faecale TaxID=2803775 RepID=A0ABS1RA54_9SPHI|nr:RagB/SusD family nutrient uptake outer membrane protein [Sphingobacterium faecale]MBL1410711.1 RagB/SusD family nutrient uptake outer membrane protein [Sphingobacterium faecale]